MPPIQVRRTVIFKNDDEGENGGERRKTWLSGEAYTLGIQ
jgi:hypothetical protein